MSSSSTGRGGRGSTGGAGAGRGAGRGQGGTGRQGGGQQGRGGAQGGRSGGAGGRGAAQPGRSGGRDGQQGGRPTQQGGRPSSQGGRPAQRGGRPGQTAPARGQRLGAPVGQRRAPVERERPAPVSDVHVADGVRLQKVLADAGLGSRRACERLIEEGRVEVDGQIVMELGVRIDPARQSVHVDGLRLELDAAKVTIVFNKPKHVVSSMDDPEGRRSLAEFFANRSERLFHVGRLDYDSEGLLLLTNDGELANRLTHPRYGVDKTYVVEVQGRVTPKVGEQLVHGVDLDDGFARIDRFQILDVTPQASLVEVVLHEGRNRIVRRMFDAVGHPVVRLVRTQMGPIRLADLPPGRHRVLGQVELGTLMKSVGL
ncbi:rRNA pseudouridine synthase [Flavimobilis sp. GY10621]|uniref:Pseudouridine synthase n=1 Tax=Flavimobilis rhizosphaerae TaxID=2775421 RepID=A0ABR9DS31_9MICO|nr:pseudouridine synthase [Flavimobilis rhizosphaerae]MBD9699901.1 rRNA pseudouridine synthase [Flavimobilis rhizosphaerae]